MNQRALFRWLWVGAILAGLLLTAANLYWGDLNQDEGWYLYAAGRVASGEMPYVDFAFTQGPALPLVYALANPLVQHWGVAGGRLFTALLAALAALCAALLATRLAGRDKAGLAALLAVVLLAVNVYQSYYGTVVKTYALTSFFLCAGFLFLAGGAPGRRGRLEAFLAGAAFSLATGTRVSAAIVLPVAFVYLLIRRRDRPAQWLWFGVGGALTGGLLFLPLLWLAPQNVIFGVLQYHSSREAGDVPAWCMYRAAFISRVVQAYFVAAVLWAGLIVMRLTRRGAPASAPPSAGAPAAAVEPPLAGLTTVLWVAVAGMTAVHVFAPLPYDDYQAMVYPLFAVAVAVGAARATADGLAARRLALIVFLAALAAACSSPINQAWFNQGRDRIWWRLKPQPALRQLQDAAAAIRELAGPEGEVLTQDTYLAVEAGLRVPRGLELGPFSYYPDWTDARARRCHVLNRAMLERLLRTCRARVAAFSGYGLTIASPAVRELPAEEQQRLWRILESRYRVVQRIPAFGQGATELVIFKRD